MESNKLPEVFAVSSEKKKQRKRDRTDYMRQYYQRHKQVVSCPNCLREFVCLRSLRRHSDKNIHCLVSRLENLGDGQGQVSRGGGKGGAYVAGGAEQDQEAQGEARQQSRDQQGGEK